FLVIFGGGFLDVGIRFTLVIEHRFDIMLSVCIIHVTGVFGVISAGGTSRCGLRFTLTLTFALLLALLTLALPLLRFALGLLLGLTLFGLQLLPLFLAFFIVIVE